MMVFYYDLWRFKFIESVPDPIVHTILTIKYFQTKKQIDFIFI